MSGTDLSYGAGLLSYSRAHTMPGAEVAYGAGLSSYVRATRCPILAYRMILAVLPMRSVHDAGAVRCSDIGSSHAFSVARIGSCYAMIGTQARAMWCLLSAFARAVRNAVTTSTRERRCPVLI
eukprot:1324922-Rhodomonas_salina.5